MMNTGYICQKIQHQPIADLCKVSPINRACQTDSVFAPRPNIRVHGKCDDTVLLIHYVSINPIVTIECHTNIY